MTPGLISVFSRQQPGLSGHKSAISLHPMYVDIDTEPKVSTITLPLCYNPDTCPEELTLRDATRLRGVTWCHRANYLWCA
jgi:hypothetical protein